MNVLLETARVRQQAECRHICSQCSELATKRQAYLLDNYRSNPASNAYGRDDCSYSEDMAEFFCAKHYEENRYISPRGYERGSTYFFGERFAHLFLEWRTIE